jgi:hypothetical protein
MPLPRFIAATALAIGSTAFVGCATDPPASKRDCFDAVEKGQQMLSVPDHSAANGWLGRAKKECLADQAQAIARLEKDIAASIARMAEREKKREDSFKPKPASESNVPGFVEAVVKYRDDKKRQKCETDPCAEVAAVGTLTVRQSTAKGALDAFRVFTRFTAERVGCDQLGPNELKRRWENPTQIKLHCALTGDSLAGLSVLLEQEKDRPETHVVVFSDKWKERDAELRSALDAAGTPAPAAPAP